MQNIIKNKNAINTAIFTSLCFVIFYFFPTKGTFQSAFVEFVFLLLIPIIYNKIILKRGANEWGFSFGNFKSGVILSLFSLLVSFVVGYILYKNFGLYERYSLEKNYTSSFLNFLSYEVTAVLFSVIVFEFFFRSFFMLNLVSLIGKWAIGAQFLLFVIFVSMCAPSIWAFAPYLIFSFFAGLITYKSGSAWYAIISQFIFVMLIDLGYVILFIK